MPAICQAADVHAGGPEVRMRSHIFAWSLAKNDGRLLTLAPLTTY